MQHTNQVVSFYQGKISTSSLAPEVALVVSKVRKRLTAAMIVLWAGGFFLAAFSLAEVAGCVAMAVAGYTLIPDRKRECGISLMVLGASVDEARSRAAVVGFPGWGIQVLRTLLLFYPVSGYMLNHLGANIVLFAFDQLWFIGILVAYFVARHDLKLDVSQNGRDN